MWAALRDKGVKLAMETVRKLMRSIGLKTELYHKRTAKYSSYKGTVGKVADNLLQQHFDEERPDRVLHTDITEYALTNGKKVCISPVVDEASLEILACTASYSPDMELVLGMLDELKTEDVQQELEDYIYCFNIIRRSNKLNYTTPVKYRDRVMATI